MPNTPTFPPSFFTPNQIVLEFSPQTLAAGTLTDDDNASTSLTNPNLVEVSPAARGLSRLDAYVQQLMNQAVQDPSLVDHVVADERPSAFVPWAPADTDEDQAFAPRWPFNLNTAELTTSGLVTSGLAIPAFSTPEHSNPQILPSSPSLNLIADSEQAISTALIDVAQGNEAKNISDALLNQPNLYISINYDKSPGFDAGGLRTQAFSAAVAQLIHGTTAVGLTTPDQDDLNPINLSTTSQAANNSQKIKNLMRLGLVLAKSLEQQVTLPRHIQPIIVSRALVLFQQFLSNSPLSLWSEAQDLKLFFDQLMNTPETREQLTHFAMLQGLIPEAAAQTLAPDELAEFVSERLAPYAGLALGFTASHHGRRSFGLQQPKQLEKLLFAPEDLRGQLQNALRYFAPTSVLKETCKHAFEHFIETSSDNALKGFLQCLTGAPSLSSEKTVVISVIDSISADVIYHTCGTAMSVHPKALEHENPHHLKDILFDNALATYSLS